MKTGLKKFIEWSKKYHSANLNNVVWLDKANKLLAEEQAQKPTAPASLIEELKNYARRLHGEESNKTQQEIGDDLKTILSRYEKVQTKKIGPCKYCEARMKFVFDPNEGSFYYCPNMKCKGGKK